MVGSSHARARGRREPESRTANNKKELDSLFASLEKEERQLEHLDEIANEAAQNDTLKHGRGPTRRSSQASN